MHSKITTSSKKKIISFSLWGSDRNYTNGAIKNAELADKIYPGWVVRYYCSKSVPIEILNHLGHADNTKIIIKNEVGDWRSSFWRFCPASDSDVSIMISRDCDSRLNLREKAAVDEWLSSEKSFHIMRDHPYHNTKILAGMWGVKNPKLRDMQKMIHEYLRGDISKETDQIFLRERIYPLIKNDCLAHDEFFDFEPTSRPFPLRRKKHEFVGEIFDCNENPNAIHRELLREYLKSKKFYIRLIRRILKLFFKASDNKSK